MKKILSVFLICIMSFSMLCACGNRKTEVSIFFKNSLTNSLNKEMRVVDAQKNADAESLAKLAISEFIKGPQNQANKALISKDAKLLSITISEGVATIDMSKHYLDKKDVDNILLRNALVNTLCSIKGIDGVVIKVDGKPIVSQADGKEIGVLTMENVVLNTEDKITVKLYFPDSDGNKLVLEERRVETQNALSLANIVVTELIKGPENKKLSAAIPKETKIVSIKTTENVCTVNFSGEFVSKTPSGSAATRMTLFSVVNSLCELKDISKVQILIDGKSDVEFGNYMFDEAFEPDLGLVK